MDFSPNFRALVESIFPRFVRIDRQSRHGKDSRKRVSESVHLSHFALHFIPMTKQSGWKCTWASCSNDRNVSKFDDDHFMRAAGRPRRILLSRLGNIGRQRVRILTYLLISGALSAAIASAQQPTVTKVEPPNWWAGHSINPVRLLVRGTNLSGASVTAGSGFRAGHVKVNAAGTYLFVDVQIPKKAAPGAYLLELKTKAGSTEIPFRIQATLSRKDHFQGFSDDDVIYLIMPDRFADGDPSNDDPADLARAPRPFEAAVLPRRRYPGRHRSSALLERPRRDGDLDYARLRQQQPAKRKEKFTMARASPIITATAPSITTAWRSISGTMETLRKLVERGAPARDQGHPGSGGESRESLSSLGAGSTDAGLVPWHSVGTSGRDVVSNVGAARSPCSGVDAQTGDRRMVRESLPDMNQENPEVARYEIQNSLWWLGTRGV